MAQRRMFSLTVVDADRFLEMPTSTQALYFHLGMRADDDGFVSSPKRILRTIGSADDDLRLLVSKGFIIPFSSGVCVITDWKQNNYIRADRYTTTIYNSEKAELETLQSGSYTLRLTDGIPNDNQPGDERVTQVRIGKGSIGEVSIGEVSIGEVTEAIASCAEPSAPADAPPRNAILTLMLNDKSEHPIFQEQVHEWAALYPAVDVIQQLRNMKGWLDANPTKRKTKRGIQKFINGWLAREQDKGSHPQRPTTGGGSGDGQREDWSNFQPSSGFKRDGFEGFHIVEDTK